MKRLTLLTILLVVVGLTAGFALELKPSFTLSGWAKVEWGIDLADYSTGFKNSAEGDLTVNLFAEDTSDTHKGEGDWYGEITIKNIELWATSDETAGATWAAGDALGFSAKIVGLGEKLAIGVFNHPDLASNTDFVASIEDDEDGDYKVLDDETGTEADFGVDYDGYGTYASYSVTDALMVGLEILSDVDWVANNDNTYAFALDVQYKVAPLTISAGVNYGFCGSTALSLGDELGFGLKVAADTDKVDGWVGFDGGAVTGDFNYEFGGGATVTLMEGVTAAAAATYGTGLNVATVGYRDLDLELIFTEPQAKGLMDNFDLVVDVWILDLLGAASEWNVIVDGGYKMGDWYPNFKVDVGDDVNTGSTAEALNGKFMNVTVGIDYTAIPLTTIGLYWKSSDFFASPVNIGDIVLSAKVTY